METPKENPDETDHTIFEYIMMFADLIMLSLESFSDEEEVKTFSHSLKGGKGSSGNTSV